MAKSKIALPSKAKILDVMEMGKPTVEGTMYVVEKVVEVFTQANKQGEFADLIGKVKDWGKENVSRLTLSTQPWLGQTPPSSDFLNAQANKASQAVEALQQSNVGVDKAVTFHFAINDKAELCRGYTFEGTKLDDKDAERSLDDLYIAWLSKNSLGTERGTLYQANEKGEIMKDGAGKQLVADPQMVRDLIADPNKGLGQFMAKEGINLTCQQQQYPAPQAQSTQKATIPSPAQEEPTADQPGMGSGRGM